MAPSPRSVSPASRSGSARVRLPAMACPSFSVISSASHPMRSASCARSACAASRTELPDEAAPKDPPEPDEGGRSLSPSTVVTRSTGKPSASAAIWVRIA